MSMVTDPTPTLFVRIRMVKESAVELITSIHTAGGPAIPVDRRAKLNDRLQHRVVANSKRRPPCTRRLEFS